jgi:hypothetical protein
MEGSWWSLIWDIVFTLWENIRVWGPWPIVWVRSPPNSSNRTATPEESWLCCQQSAVKHPDRLWVTPSILSKGCRWVVFRDQTARLRSWAFTSVANLKNAIGCTFTLPRVFMAWWWFESKWSFVFYRDFCNNWRTPHSTEQKIAAGYCGKTHILEKVKRCEA